MQENTRLAFIALWLLTLAQKESKERRDLDAQTTTLHLIGT